MSRVMKSLGTVGLALAVAAPVAAQTPASATPAAPTPPVAQTAPASAVRPTDRNELKHQIYVMEGALSAAVEFGAKQLNRELQSAMPGIFLLAGQAQARGVYLEGYGIFFDVEVPMLRESMMWSVNQILRPNPASVKTATDQLRSFVAKTVSNQTERAPLEAAIRQLETQAAPAFPLGLQNGQQVDPNVTLPGAPEPPVPMSPADSNRAYTQAVQKAIIDAMLDYSPPRAIGPDEWLTVAARDNERRDTLAPADPFQEVVTVLMRIKGSDLMEYRSGKIDRDEARKRVRLGEF